MTNITKDFENIILRAGIDGALTEEAVAQFHALVKERDALKTANDDYFKLTDEHDATIKDLTTRLLAAETCAQEWAGREQDMMDRESKCTELEIRKECADLRVTDHKEMFTTVFRNSVLRKEVMTPLDSTDPNEYNSCPPGGHAQKDTVEEEET